MAFWTILETTILAFTQSKDELIKKLSLKIRLFPILSFVTPSIGNFLWRSATNWNQTQKKNG